MDQNDGSDDDSDFEVIDSSESVQHVSRSANEGIETAELDDEWAEVRHSVTSMEASAPSSIDVTQSDAVVRNRKGDEFETDSCGTTPGSVANWELCLKAADEPTAGEEGQQVCLCLNGSCFSLGEAHLPLADGKWKNISVTVDRGLLLHNTVFAQI